MKKILFVVMAMFAFGLQNVNAQDEPQEAVQEAPKDAPLTIVSNHPDFKIKVKRCAASGKTVIIDLLLTNTGTQDVDGLVAYGGRDEFGHNLPTQVYDIEGNIYNYQIYVKLANSEKYSIEQWVDLLPDVPVKMSVKVEGVSTTAEAFARVRLSFKCNKWGLYQEKPAVLRNIPISRD